MSTLTTTTSEASALEAAFQRSGISLPVPFMELSATIIRDLPISHVADLKCFEAAAKSELAALSNMIQTGLDMRYGEQAKAQLLAENKDTGTTHVVDGNFDVTVEVSKDVTWDQKALQAIWNRMVAAGQDPTEFITAKYNVSESRFKAWPEVFRQPFMAARTVKPKAAKFTLRKPSADEGAQ
ncbi:MAG: hypothetical protein Q8M20_00085 [Rhodocyclaceae bacterium]|nr:hypothetical protein [Rhodocyclaceae bacterium]